MSDMGFVWAAQQQGIACVHIRSPQTPFWILHALYSEFPRITSV